MYRYFLPSRITCDWQRYICIRSEWHDRLMIRYISWYDFHVTIFPWYIFWHNDDDADDDVVSSLWGPHCRPISGLYGNASHFHSLNLYLFPKFSIHAILFHIQKCIIVSELIQENISIHEEYIGILFQPSTCSLRCVGLHDEENLR